MQWSLNNCTVVRVCVHAETHVVTVASMLNRAIVPCTRDGDVPVAHGQRRQQSKHHSSGDPEGLCATGARTAS